MIGGRGHRAGPSVHQASARRAAGGSGWNFDTGGKSSVRIDKADPTAHGVADARMGPATFAHPKGGVSSSFTKAEWDRAVNSSSLGVKTDILYGYHEIWTVAARDGTRLFYFIDEAGTRKLVSWDFLNNSVIEKDAAPLIELPGFNILRLLRIPLLIRDPDATGSRTVFGLPIEKMGPAFYTGQGFEGRNRFALREWETIVSPEQQPLTTDYRYMNEPVLTVTAKDGTQLYYVRDADGVHTLLSWDKLRQAPSFETARRQAEQSWLYGGVYEFPSMMREPRI